MYFKIEKSDLKNKKYKATFYDKDKKKVKTTHFGNSSYEDYTTHQDMKRKSKYIERHKKNENWNDYKSAGSLSRYILWNLPNLQESIKNYAKRFALKQL